VCAAAAVNSVFPSFAAARKGRTDSCDFTQLTGSGAPKKKASSKKEAFSIPYEIHQKRIANGHT